MNIYEYAILAIFSLIISTILYFSFSTIQTNKKEYWTGYITHAIHQEPWNELVVYTVVVSDGKDTRTEIRTRIDHHPAYWGMYDNNGIYFSISQDDYLYYKKLWVNETVIGTKYGYTINGNTNATYFNQNDSFMIIVKHSHSYENKVNVSRSVFNNFEDISQEDIKKYNLIDYPYIKDNYVSSILGHKYLNYSMDNRKLDILNAKIGKDKQIKVWLLTFKNQPFIAGRLQRSYWKNGNMNEMVICVGLDKDDKVTWSNVFSWTDSTSLLINTREKINHQIGKSLNFQDIIPSLEKDIRTQWVRKDFHKDFKYLQIRPPNWAISLAFVISLIVNGVMAVVFIKNNWDCDSARSYRGYYG
jgi:hypothetical protein